jgi:hypothetical protein
MSRVKINDNVYRLKNDCTLNIPNLDTINFKGAQEFHIVADVLYMGGFPLPIGLQDYLINWINTNPSLFISDNRGW